MAATGGSGRSGLACLLAGELAAAADTVVLDLGVRLASPWPAWTQTTPAGEAGQAGRAGPGAGGLAALPSDRPHTRDAIRSAAVRRGAFDVLTDGREWNAPPLALPSEPAAWYQLAAAGGWRIVVADTAHPVGYDVLAARCAGLPGATRGWCELPYSVPVLCAAATAHGVQVLQQAVMAMTAEGMPLRRTVVVLVGLDGGRAPAVVRAAAAMLADRAYDVLELPHDADVRAHGLRGPGRPRPRTRQAAARIAEAVLEAAHSAWGEPLPDAPVPAPAPAFEPTPQTAPIPTAK
ncbi:hypothetical protein ACFWUQ_02500 [Streptomyces sp. NPDC058662]|uniref:hypothetical protein n=1 Tax=Streptomyces sp. NPDC058662 TaxID=3346583 RepID=UPI0036521E37